MSDISNMPRGGPDASCLDRLLVTDRAARPTALLRDDRLFAHLALAEVAEVPDPRILVLGTAQDGLADELRQAHPTATVTVSDTVGDGQFALAVLAMQLHRLSPAAAAEVIARATEAAAALLIIDMARPPSVLHAFGLATALPLAFVVPVVASGVVTSLRSYSPSALRALAEHAGADIELRNSLLGPQIAVATRR